jgi:hypothetical protein
MHTHSRDQSDLLVATITQLLRFQAGTESPLSLIEGAEKEIDVSMQAFGKTGLALLTLRALTLMNNAFSHELSP